MEMRNRVYQGDCLEVMSSIPDKCIDMVLCDLPYGTTKCKWDTIIPLEPLWSQYKRIVKDNGAGSGSTGVACKRTGRDYLLIEHEEKYVKIIEERLLTMK